MKLNLNGVNNPNYKDGRTLKTNRVCIVCGTILKNCYALHCKSCFYLRNRGANHWKYKPPNVIKCIDCGKILKSRKASRCKSCNMKDRITKYPEKYNSSIRPKKIKITKYCLDCQKEIKRGIRCNSCAIKYRYKISKDWITGENNPAWLGGISYLPYSPSFNDILKDKIRKRDNYTCQNCNMLEEEHLIVYGKNLAIHHIDYNKSNSLEDNLISLCTSCNIRANYNRDYWKNFYKSKISLKIKVEGTN